jgi:hypothetical protein
VRAALDGAHAKLSRAQEHLQEFEHEAAKVNEAVPRTLCLPTTYDPEGQRFIAYLTEEPAIPPRLSTIAGDVLHNLRSALDHLAYQLVILATGEPWEKSQWPIVISFEAIETDSRFRKLRDLLLAAGREDLWAHVEFHQAVWYVDDMDGAARDGVLIHRQRRLPLLALHSLSILDKHKLLVEPFFIVASYRRIEPRCIADCDSPEPIQSWGLWYTLRKDAPPLAQFTGNITGPAPRMDVDIEFELLPVGLAGLGAPALEWLGLMVDAVGGILLDFGPFF